MGLDFLIQINKLCRRASVMTFLQQQPQSAGETSKIKMLYELLNRKEANEEMITEELYGEGVTPYHPPYRQLKSRLRRIMVDAYLLQMRKEPSYKDYDEAYLHGNANLAVLRMLLLDQAYVVVRDIASNVFENVRKYEIVPLNEGLTDVLASCYLSIFPSKDTFRKYQELNRYYSKATYDLNIVKLYYRESRLRVNMQRQSPLELGEKALEMEPELREIAERYPSISQIQAMVTNMLASGCIQRGEYKEAIEHTQSGLHKLNHCKGVSKRTLVLCCIQITQCAIKLADFNLGKKYIDKARGLVRTSSINALKIADLSVVLGMRTGRYDYAYKAYANTSRNLINRLLTPRHIEYWDILEASINLLIRVGEYTPPKDGPKIRKFRFSKFSNTISKYNRIKDGANVQLLILQCIYLVIEKKYDKLIDRENSLKSYSSRYLHRKENLRNLIFFKLLGMAIRCNLNKPQTIAKSARLLKQLQNADDFIDVNGFEHIPYDKLWEIFISYLPTDRKARAKKVKPSPVLKETSN